MSVSETRNRENLQTLKYVTMAQTTLNQQNQYGKPQLEEWHGGHSGEGGGQKIHGDSSGGKFSKSLANINLQMSEKGPP